MTAWKKEKSLYSANIYCLLLSYLNTLLIAITSMRYLYSRIDNYYNETQSIVAIRVYTV